MPATTPPAARAARDLRAARAARDLRAARAARDLRAARAARDLRAALATRAVRNTRATRSPRTIRLRRPGRLLASALAAMCLLAVVTACSAPAASSPPSSSSGDAHLYLTCLIGQLNRGSDTGARKACQSQRPAGGLGPALQSFARCLQGHGVVLPSESPGTTTGDALRYLNQVRTGSAAQRAAFNACQASTR